MTRFPEKFLWGTATAAHQVEGGNTNNDWWEWEHAANTACVEVSGDACDHYWRYPQDLDILSELGFGAYRFSLEWSRIEPEEGEFSASQLDHYARVLDACHERNLLPVLTYHHFTTPLWATADGGWANPAIVDRFTRFCEHATERLGSRIGMACTINEPNVVTTIGYLMGAFPPGNTGDRDGFLRATENMVAAHRSSYEAIKAGPGDFPVGLTLSMSDWGAEEGYEDQIAKYRGEHEDIYLEAAQGNDFFGVQSYSRTRVGAKGVTGPEPGVEVLPMGYEYWPTAAEASIRHAAEFLDIPLYVTENGIGTNDDEKRKLYLHDSLTGIARTIDDGIDVRGFFQWSLLDNFEWAFGYQMRFGLVEVDRVTQKRTMKPSAYWLSEIIRSQQLPN
ncbi:MAG: family 1 glycosylhydrolase [Acidimicrobiia bacterium]|nr:family 1 glycosylhydrolase [Acidimicrobiia bacterium]